MLYAPQLFLAVKHNKVMCNLPPTYPCKLPYRRVYLKERLLFKNEVEYCITNNVILFNTEHGFMENKNIVNYSRNNSANCIHYWSCRDCQVKRHRLCILPFRLLRNQCYRADSSNIIHNPMCETLASVLSTV